MRPDLHVVPTGDGSLTLFSEQFNEHYHSTHGARQESMHVFIQMGLACVPLDLTPIHILEVGGGTLLNAWLTHTWVRENNREGIYHLVEAYPPTPESLRSFWSKTALSEAWLNVYAQPVPLALKGMTLEHRYRKLEEADLMESKYDLVYFDAFAPSKQPELWTADIFKKIYHAMAVGGILVTYCAQGQFKRNLKEAGFLVEALPGPPGKREMTRAKKA
jgi:tRNA U34 5-methylaminomethyl-2-thiouridine-forming methyltransferase MnmC